MRDEIGDEAIKSLRAIVLKVDELSADLNVAVAKAKQMLVYIDALEKDRLLDEELAKRPNHDTGE